MNIQDFIEKHGDKLKMEIVSTDVIDQDWKYFHWTIDLSFDGRAMTVDYYGGKKALEPELEELLLNLSSDCTWLRDYKLEEFLIECGYCDSADKLREGFKAYEKMQENDKELRELFGDEYETFLTLEED